MLHSLLLLVVKNYQFFAFYIKLQDWELSPLHPVGSNNSEFGRQNKIAEILTRLNTLPGWCALTTTNGPIARVYDIERTIFLRLLLPYSALH